MCFWVSGLIFISYPLTPLLLCLSVTEDFSDKIWVWPNYTFMQCLSSAFTSINIDNLCWFTGSPKKCPQIYSRACPEHTTCHHEAHRRAASLLTATDSSNTHRKSHIQWITSTFILFVQIKLTTSSSSNYTHFVSRTFFFPLLSASAYSVQRRQIYNFWTDEAKSTSVKMLSVKITGCFVTLTLVWVRGFPHVEEQTEDVLRDSFTNPLNRRKKLRGLKVIRDKENCWS